MSISLTDFVDSVAGERIAELEAEVEELEELIRHIYVHGTMLTRDQHEAMLGWKAKTKGESNATR